MEMFDLAPDSMVVTSHMWLLKIWNVASATKELNV